MSDEPDNLTPRPRRGGIELPDGWEGKFFRALRKTAVVGRACMAAGISRQTAYAHRERDDDFAQKWDSIIEDCVDELERVCRRLAVRGARRGVYYKGARIDTFREYPTSLQIFLLKAYRPQKFGDMPVSDDPIAELFTKDPRLLSAKLPPGAIPSLPREEPNLREQLESATFPPDAPREPMEDAQLDGTGGDSS